MTNRLGLVFRTARPRRRRGTERRSGQAPAGDGVTVFEGARLIAGDGSAAIEDSAIVVSNGKFTEVGRRGQVKVPANAARVNLNRQDGHPGDHRHAHAPRHHARCARRSAAAPRVLRDRRHAQPGTRMPATCRSRSAARRSRMRRATGRRDAASRCRRRAGPKCPTGSPPRPRRARPCRSSPTRKVDIVKIWVDDRERRLQEADAGAVRPR